MAGHLTAAQKLAIKNDILANPDLDALPNNSDGAFEIARLYNLNASPNFTVWKTSVDITTIGDNIVGTELSGLTSLNISRLQAVITLSTNGVNPSLTDRRAFFDDIFSGAGGTQTRARLLTLWKRLALRIEKLFAVGTGSDATPANLVWQGTIDYQSVELARNS